MIAQQRAEIYADLYIVHYNLREYLKAAKTYGLEQNEAEVVWESIDRYEDIRPEEH